MDISGDKITIFKSSHHREHRLYECLPCRFQANNQATFLNHKITRICSKYHGDWFIKMKKKGYKNYFFIVWRYGWDKVMNDIRK
jgi:hypothetical protein